MNVGIDNKTLLGIVAGALTSLSFIPQVLKTWRSRSAKDLSLGMYAVFCVGISLWITYGFMIDSLPVIAWNTVTLFLGIGMLYMKIRFK